MTGLRAPIRQHLLLQGAPTTMDTAVKQTVAIEYALDFTKTTEDAKEVNAVQTRSDGAESVAQLQHAMEQLTQRLQSLESQLASTTASDGTRCTKKGPTPSQFTRRRGRCYLCGEEGHYRRECHLNFVKPAQRASCTAGRSSSNSLHSNTHHTHYRSGCHLGEYGPASRWFH